MRAISWQQFESAAPDFAEAGRRLLVGEVAFLATVSRAGDPRLAPFCPIFSGGHLFVCAASKTPKRHDLENDGRYVLHAMLGPNDEEFQLTGRASWVGDEAQRARVHCDITFAFDAADPIFRFEIERALWGYWENPGQPGTVPVRRRFRVGEGVSAV